MIHRIWLGSELPESFVEYGRTWHEHHPSWTQVLWTDHPQRELPYVRVATLPQLRNQAIFDAAPALVRAANVGQFRADLLRYELLVDHGGVYVDADFECLRPIDELLGEDVHAFAAWETDQVWVNNAILGAELGHLFFQQLVDGIAPRLRVHGRDALPATITGPKYITALYRSNEHHGMPVPTVFAAAMFYPYRWDELDRRGESFPAAFAVHHWANRRRSRAAR